MSAIDRYFNAVQDQIEWVAKNQSVSIEKAAQVCADSIQADGLVFTFGTGHGAFPALESFPRTGSVTGFRPIVESSLLSMHHVWGDTGTSQYRFIHKVEGFGKAILKSHHIADSDSLILFSHSGINPVIIDMALHFKELNLPVIAVTSIPHSSKVEGRHSSKKRLFEVADVVIDSGVPSQDAAVEIEDFAYKVGPISTSVVVAISNAINSRTTEILVERGYTPMVMVNPNTASALEANKHNDLNYQDLWRRLKGR
jgi:uncharacterized phosphosugar-binding protein